MLVACAVAVLALSKEAQAAFPGKNGKIAFSAEGGPGSNNQIYTVNPDGTGEKQLTNTSRSYNDAPSYSSDGTKLVWERNGNIWIMNADGTGKERLTAGPADDRFPAFSPGGRRVAFGRHYHEGGKPPDIYIKALDGGALRWVTNDQNREGHPVFSPDGGRIAFSRSETIPGCGGGCGSYYGEIATVRPDGTGFKVITDTPSQAEAYSPDWSPDGRRLVFLLEDYRTEQERIETVRVDGTGRRTVFAPSRFYPSSPAQVFHSDPALPVWATLRYPPTFGERDYSEVRGSKLGRSDGPTPGRGGASL